MLTQARVLPGIGSRAKFTNRSGGRGLLAVLRVGGIYLPLNTAYTGAELQYFLDDAEPSTVVVDPSLE